MDSNLKNSLKTLQASAGESPGRSMKLLAC
jgi:hypothetical protein